VLNLDNLYRVRLENEREASSHEPKRSGRPPSGPGTVDDLRLPNLCPNEDDVPQARHAEALPGLEWSQGCRAASPLSVATARRTLAATVPRKGIGSLRGEGQEVIAPGPHPR
jgi:hypothetical protein